MYNDGRNHLDVRFWPHTRVANGVTCPNPPRNLFDYYYESLMPIVPGLVALHNNYIFGMMAKIRRQQGAGLWFLDADGVCLL